MGGNGLPLTVEQGTEEEQWPIFTGLAALGRFD
jgi:hypothetical protein